MAPCAWRRAPRTPPLAGSALGFMLRVLGFGFRVSGFGFRVSGFDFRVWGLGWGFGFQM